MAGLMLRGCANGQMAERRSKRNGGERPCAKEADRSLKMPLRMDESAGIALEPLHGFGCKERRRAR